jgi:hypothetical protein
LWYQPFVVLGFGVDVSVAEPTVNDRDRVVWVVVMNVTRDALNFWD